MQAVKEISKKYGQPRKTGIINEKHVEVITEEVLIEDYNVKLFLQSRVILKNTAYFSQGFREQKIKEDDEIIQEIEARNKNELILFPINM